MTRLVSLPPEGFEFELTVSETLDTSALMYQAIHSICFRFRNEGKEHWKIAGSPQLCVYERLRGTANEVLQRMGFEQWGTDREPEFAGAIVRVVLSFAELRVVVEMMATVCEGPFIPEWEFAILLGGTREELREIMHAFHRPLVVNRADLAIELAGGPLVGRRIVREST